MSFIQLKQPQHKAFFKRSLLTIAVATIAGTTTTTASASFLDDPTRKEIEEALEGDSEYYGFDVTALPNDEFAVVWAEHHVNSGDSIKLQKYSGQGEKLGDAIEVFTYPDKRFAWNPTIAADQAGNLVIAWGESKDGRKTAGTLTSSCTPSGTNGVGDGVQVRRLPTPVNSNDIESVTVSGFKTDDLPCDVKVAMDEDGDFALLWATPSASGSSTVALSMQVFSAEGSAVFPSSSAVADSFLPGDLAFYDENNLIVAYTQIRSDGQASAIMGQRYDHTGKLIESAFRLDNGATTTNAFKYQLLPNLAATPDLEGDGFVVAWRESVTLGRHLLSGENISLQVRAQRWRADATEVPALLPPVVLARYESVPSSSAASTPSLDVDSDGHLLAAWTMSFYEDKPDEDFDSFNDASLFALSTDEVTELDQTVRVNDYENKFTEFGANDFQSARVAISDQAKALVWLDGGFGGGSRGDSKSLKAIFVSGVDDPDIDPDDPNSKPQSNNSSGGSLSWLSGLMALLFGVGRYTRGQNNARR